ncbi:MAG: hypothetical protein QOG77_1962 [Solirubrobacteraceae bacterium]|jgi:hypothetical protein|nr:hypothetical protein [Solirubrobacteraceae bacterium]
MDLGGFLRRQSLYASPLAVKGYALLRRVAARLGFQVVLKTFYSPIPDLDALPAGTFDRVSELPGVAWDLDAQAERLAAHGPSMAAFRPDRYERDNPSFGMLDAKVLYAVVRDAKPKRVVELGSGHSTLVTTQAARENAADGHPCQVDAYDPYPAVVTDDLPGLHALHRTPAQEVPFAIFETLEAGDVLFVDTTHTVKLGSDVNHIVLEVLPRLKPGVIVHVHDIFLPYEYPRFWPEKFGFHWAEQYLLHAFLAMNSSYEVLLSVPTLRRDRPGDVERVAPDAMHEAGSSFWMRRAT